MSRTHAGSHDVTLIPSWFLPVWIIAGGTALLAAAALRRTAPDVSGYFQLAGLMTTLMVPLFAVRTKRGASVVIDRLGVSVEGAIWLESPLKATRVDARGATSVAISGRGGKLTIKDVTPEAIVSIMEASTGSGAVTWTTFPVHGELFNIVRGGVIAGLAAAGFGVAMGVLGPLLIGLGFAIVMGLLAFRMNSRRLTISVGDDGIALQGGTAARFFPLAKITECELSLDGAIAEGVRLTLEDGSSVDIAVPSTPAGKGTPREEPARGVCAEIDRRLAAIQSAPRAGHERAASALPPRRESTLEWVRELRARRERAPSYRDRGSLDVDEILAVVEDPAAAPMLRVAAAIELAGSPEARKRVADAAERSGDATLAKALRVVADDGPETELIEAIEELDEVAR